MSTDNLLQEEDILQDLDLDYELALASLGIEDDETEETEEAEKSTPRPAKSTLRRTEITRWAFQQNDIDLSTIIPREHIQALIKVLTEPHIKAMEHYEEFINRRFTVLLGTLIPKTLKGYYNKYPQAFVRHPGFLYENPNGLLFWVLPKVPYFFRQGQEPEILRSAKPIYLTKIDQAINQYHEHQRLHGYKQVRYAMRFVRCKVVTYYDLLKHNAVWFEILHKEVMKDDILRSYIPKVTT